MNTENNTNRGINHQKAHNIAPNNGKKRVRRLTPEEIEARRIQAEELRIEKRQTFIVRFIFGTLVYLLCCGIIFGAVFSMYFRSEEPDILTLQVLDTKGNVLSTSEGDKFIINNVPYISATELSYLYDFTLAGDKTRVSLHFHNADESLSLTKDSTAVSINGSSVRLTAPIIFTDDYYIPLELIRNYFNGVTIVYDNEEETARLSVKPDLKSYLRLYTQNDTPQA